MTKKPGRREASMGLLALLFLGACPAPDPTQGLGTTMAPSTVLSYNAFVCDALPVLVKRCSYLGCHGQDQHALRIYSVGKLRLGDASTRQARSFALLSQDEVQRNFESAVAIDAEASPDDRMNLNLDKLPLLRKPLAARFGGDEHQDVAIFPVSPYTDVNNDPEFQALLAWVIGSDTQMPPSAKCKQTFDDMNLTPQ